MQTDAATGALVPFDFGGIYDEFPSLRRLNVDIEVHTMPKLIDSSNVRPEDWSDMADVIRDNYDRYDGFVILHGTDTMSYSASALSFMLENLAKPVVFTGSQIPIGVLRTDGRENLITAIEIAGARIDGRPVVPEVSLLFQNPPLPRKPHAQVQRRRARRLPLVQLPAAGRGRRKDSLQLRRHSPRTPRRGAPARGPHGRRRRRNSQTIPRNKRTDAARNALGRGPAGRRPRNIRRRGTPPRTTGSCSSCDRLSNAESPYSTSPSATAARSRCSSTKPDSSSAPQASYRGTTSRQRPP